MERIREIKSAHVERPIITWNGFIALAIGLALVVLGLWQLFQGVAYGRSGSVTGLVTTIVIFVLLFIAGLLFLSGLYTLQPNEAALLQLFGSYRGTTRVAGLRGTNPFYTRRKVSLRARNLNGERLKVNDKRGNPIEIAAVVVWRVDDTAKASFDVDNYENYVKLQSEAAVRHLASSFAYDHGDVEPGGVLEPTLLGGSDLISRALVMELHAAARESRRRGRRSPADASRLCARNRAGDAAPAAGRGDHRRAAEDRPWRSVDGRDGAQRVVGKESRRAG